MSDLKVVGVGSGNGLIKKLPSPPKFLSDTAKGYYRKIGKILISAQVLKELHITNLSMLATNLETWDFAVSEIKRKNEIEMGTGFIQTYQSKATNLSSELILKRNAEDAIRKDIDAFGMSPLAAKKISAAIVDPNQTDLFAAFDALVKDKVS